MISYKIQGKQTLNSELSLLSSVDLTCSFLSCSLIYPTVNHLYNCSDAPSLKEYIRFMQEHGITFQVHDSSILIDSNYLNLKDINIRTFRNTGLAELIPALVARLKKISFRYSFNDMADDSINVILDAFKLLGIKTEEIYSTITCDASEYKGGYFTVYYPTSLLIRSILLVSVLCEGETIIEIDAESDRENTICDPTVIQLQNFLNKMGAQVTGVGTGLIKVQGVKELHGTSFIISPAKSEVCSYIYAAVITGGNLTIKNIFYDMSQELSILEKLGCKVLNANDSINVAAPPVSILSDSSILTNIFPLLARANGLSIYEYDGEEKLIQTIEELKKMGASIDMMRDTVTIDDDPPLKGSKLITRYPSAAKVLICAALIAKGQTLLQLPMYIDHQLSSYIKNLKLLGANIEKIE